MDYEQQFDDILASILTDFQNILPGVDVSQGSLAYMKAAGYASALWGLYRYQAWIARQIFPDTADTEALEHHAWLRGLARVGGETDAELLARLLDIIRRPPAGGNKHDYRRWALEIDNVAQAYCYPLAQGDGSVDVVILADIATGSEIPNAGLLAAVAAHIDDVRPVTHSLVRVLAPVVVTQAVTMACTGSGLNLPAIAAEISAYLSSMEPMQVLYRSKLSAIAIQMGATNAVVTVPAGDVTPASNNMIRPGAINVA